VPRRMGGVPRGAAVLGFAPISACPESKSRAPEGVHSFGSPAVSIRPVAFRPRLTTGLAFRERGFLSSSAGHVAGDAPEDNPGGSTTPERPLGVPCARPDQLLGACQCVATEEPHPEVCANVAPNPIGESPPLGREPRCGAFASPAHGGGGTPTLRSRNRNTDRQFPALPPARGGAGAVQAWHTAAGACGAGRIQGQLPDQGAAVPPRTCGSPAERQMAVACAGRLFGPRAQRHFPLAGRRAVEYASVGSTTAVGPCARP
jgi:hypothetical protein